MATHDYVIDNSTGANVRADINNALAAIVSNNSSSSQPTTRYAYMWWADTTNGVLKIRNSANDGWVELLQLDGTITLEDGSASAPALANRGDLDTGVFFSADNTFNVATSGVERMELGSTTIFNEDGQDVDFRIEGDNEPNLFYVDAGNDRIGIGSNSPSEMLEVIDSANSARGIKVTNTNNSGGSAHARIEISGGDNAKAILKLECNGHINELIADGSGNFRIDDNDSEVFRIDSNGRCGIGISSPSNQLHVKHATTNTVALFESGDAQTLIAFKDNSTSTNPAIGTTNDDMVFFTGTLQRMTILSGGNIGIGETSPSVAFHLKHATQNGVMRLESGDEFVHLEFKDSTTSNIPYIGAQGDAMRIITGGSERFRIDNDADLIGFSAATGRTFNEMKTATGTGNEGSRIGSDGAMVIGASNTGQLLLNRRTTDGTIINLLQNGTSEGSIDVSGSTVSYNGGHLSRWSQLSGISTTDKSARPEIYQGTVMSNLDELCTWSHPAELWTRDVPYSTEDTLPEGKSVGDVQFAKGSVRREAYTEENQQLNMTKVSDTEGDKDVAGVFWAWDDDDDEIVNDFFIAMTGDMVIRVAASTTVARGDLMISAGDGTAKPQADDIIRSSTIAKIISTNHTATYADGSKAYPCVLMAC